MKCRPLVLSILLASFGLSQTPVIQSSNMGDVQWLVVATAQAERIAYLAGVRDGMLQADIGLDRDVASQYFVKGSNFGEASKAVDLFYEEPSNLPIPTGFALRINTMKATGTDSATIENATADIRRRVADTGR